MIGSICGWELVGNVNHVVSQDEKLPNEKPLIVTKEMLKFDRCWKCEGMYETIVPSNTLLIDVCSRVCENDTCDTRTEQEKR